MPETPSSEYDLAPVQDEAAKPGASDQPATEIPRSQAPQSPPKPLPRIHKSAPLTVAEAQAKDEAAEPGQARRSSRSDRRTARDRERDPVGADLDGKKPMAPTPELDTYDSRQRIRMILGTLAAGAVLLALFSVFRSVTGGSNAGEDDFYVIEDAEMFGPANASAPAIAPAPAGNAPGSGAPDISQAMAPSLPESRPLEATAPAPIASVPSSVPPLDISSISRTPVTPAGPLQNALPIGFQAHPQAEVDPSGWPTVIQCDRDGSEMILIAGGVYILGRNDGSQAEAPAVQVELPPFYIDRHEVTVEQYERYRADATRRGERIYPRPEEMAEAAPTPRHPAVLVNWLDASGYARWAGKALPSEAQWEAAARGLDGRIRPWGGGTAPWGANRAYRQIDPVLSYPADITPTGVADLGNNAWEWTADWYDSSYHQALRDTVVMNPGGPSASRSSPPQRTIKGSSRAYESSYREGMRLDARLPFLGFRCALPVGGPPQAVDTQGSAPNRPGQPTSQPGPAGAVVPF